MLNKIHRLNSFICTVFCCLIFISSSHAEDWSNTEVHLQYGKLHQTGTGGAEANTFITTLQHAGGWKYGENFFFFDHSQFNSKGNGDNQFNPGQDGSELYGEWYSTLYLGSISGLDLKIGPVKDFGLIMGFNVAPEVDAWWFLPGVRFALDIPGFAFANLDVTAFLNHSTADSSDTSFKILDEGDSYMVDFNWAYPFNLGSTSWSLEGHVEYIDGRSQRNTFGKTQLKYWVLAQPQLRLDLGKVLGNTPEQLFVGIEYQYWKNKQGEKGLTDNTAQLLLVWRW